MAQYLRADCEQGFVTDSAEIENLKFNNMRHTILGCMLGDFDAEGNYVVDPQIVEELIAMPKYIVDTVDNVDVCTSVIKLDRQITFFVTYEGEQAVLTLAEKVNFQANFKTNSGLFSNINEYILDSFETSGVIDKNAVYAKWHISPFGGNAMDVFNMDQETLSKYYGIVNRFKYLMKANQIMLENEDKIEEIETNYAVQMMQIIAKYPGLKKVVDAKIKDVVSKQPSVIRLDKPFFAKTVNEVINQTIEANISTLKPEEKQEFEVERRNLLVEQNVKLSQVVDVINAPVLGEQQETITTKCMLNTNGVERRQSLTDVAADYIVTKNKVSSKIVQQAVAETLNPAVREKFVASTGTTINQTKQTLIDLIAKSAGQTTEQLGKNIVDSSTTDVVSLITKKHAEAQTNLVARAAGADATVASAAAKAAGGDKKADKKGADKKKAGGAKKPSSDKKAAAKTTSVSTSSSAAASSRRAVHDKGVYVSNAGESKTVHSQHAADTLANAKISQVSTEDDSLVESQLAKGLNTWENRTNQTLDKSIENQGSVINERIQVTNSLHAAVDEIVPINDNEIAPDSMIETHEQFAQFIPEQAGQTGQLEHSADQLEGTI